MQLKKKYTILSLLLLAVVHLTFAADVNSALKNISYSVKKYDYSFYNKLISQTTANANGQFTNLQTKTGQWQVSSTVTACFTDTGAVDVNVTFKLLSGFEKSGAVAVEFNFADWSKDNYVLMPSAAYNGNRFESRKIAYSPKLNDARDIGKDKPMIISDVPRLNIADGLSRIQDRSGSMALPCIGFHEANSASGFFLITKQANSYGDYGMNIEESRDRKKAVISISSPLVRELYKYTICDNQVASTDIPADFKAGDEVSFSFRLYHFKAPRIQSLFDKYLQVRHDLCPPSEFIPRIPFSASYSVIENKFNRQNFVQEWGYYSVGMRNMFLQDWQIGWTGGMISTYPLLFSDNPKTHDNVIANFNWLFPNGISPSGFFWDSGEKGNRWYGGDIRKPQAKNWHLIRKSADALYYIFKQFGLMKLQGTLVKPVWENGTRGVADAFVKLWKNNHQFGQFVDSQTGEIAVGGSSGAGIAPAALVFASQYFHNQAYLTVAEESAQQMYNDYLAKGISCGGVGDALQNIDSESLYGLLESFAVLYEATGDKKWLQYACDAAAQFSTWVMSYDYVFPPESLFGQMNMKTTGAVFANTQNKHGSPGICTHSGLALMRLYRATGNEQYLNLLQEITRAVPQFLSHKDRPIKGLEEGWINERVSTTDWFEGIGEIFPGSTWAETDLLLTITELPGIYVDLEKRKVTSFDQLQVELISCNAASAKLRITNPTSLPAQTSVLVENRESKQIAWKENRFFKAKKLQIESGKSIIVTVLCQKQIEK